MALHGGCFETYFSRDRVTHLVCSNLPDTKLKQLAANPRWAGGRPAGGVLGGLGAAGSRLCLQTTLHALRVIPPPPNTQRRKPVAIVRPEWVVASLRAGHLLPVSSSSGAGRGLGCCPAAWRPLG